MINHHCARTFKKPTHSFKFDTKLKIVASDKVYFDHHQTFYCSCDFEPSPKGSSGSIDPSGCGYIMKNANSAIGLKLEWEHVMPASSFGQHRDSWKLHKNEEFCGSKSESGRECSRKYALEFRLMEADLNNLVPEISELNRHRGNKPYGLIPGEIRMYGDCDFEVSSGKNAVAEPTDEIRGDIARVALYS